MIGWLKISKMPPLIYYISPKSKGILHNSVSQSAGKIFNRKSGLGMSNGRYSMSFTTGSLFHRESVEFALMYLELKNWNVIRQKVLSENLLQARTLNTLKRVCSEIISRLKKLSFSELELLTQATLKEQSYLLWLAICRRYGFIADFALEVIRERYISLKSDLHHDDFDSFFNRKSEWHPELDKIRPATRVKLRQVLFKILREADLLTASNTIHAAIPSPQFLAVISQSNRQDLLFLPAFESDLRGLP